MARMPASDIAKILRQEKALWVSVLSAVVFAVYGDHWFGDLSHFVTASILFLWLFAVIMIALNGMAGVTLLLGGLRHREQQYNLQGANAFLAVIVPLATISLTIPAVLIIGMLSGKHIVLGLTGEETVMLLVTLLVSILTFASGRTNVLQGAVHILLFLAYIMLIFD